MNRKLCIVSGGLIGGLLISALADVGVAAEKPSPAAYKPERGRFSVATQLAEWRDGARDRTVPVKIYFPPEAKGPLPIVPFSHGLGGTRATAQYLGEYWASHGYVSVHLQHPGSDAAVWRRGEVERSLKEAAADPRNAIDRADDVHFALDQLERLNQEDATLKGRLDLARIGMCGHSFGANTTLLVVGQEPGGGRGGAATLADPRIKAAMPLSAPVPELERRRDEVYRGIDVPCMHMTGTLDDSPIGGTKAADRRVPFDRIRGVDQYLITFAGGDHMIFSGHQRLRGDGAKDEHFRELIQVASTAFWNAYLKDNPAAKAFLSDGGLRGVLGDDAVLETKAPAD